MEVKKNMDKSRADNYLRSFTIKESGKWSTMEREMGRVDFFLTWKLFQHICMDMEKPSRKREQLVMHKRKVIMTDRKTLSE